MAYRLEHLEPLERLEPTCLSRLEPFDFAQDGLREAVERLERFERLLNRVLTALSYLLSTWTKEG